MAKWKKCPVCHTRFELVGGRLPPHGACLGSELLMIGPAIHSGLTMKQSVRVKIAPEVAADLEAVEAIPTPGATLKEAAGEELADWMAEFKKACPEAFNKRLGARLGPPQRMD